MPTKERIAYAAIASLSVAGIAYMGFANRRPPAIVFENLPVENRQAAVTTEPPISGAIPVKVKPIPTAKPRQAHKTHSAKKKATRSTSISLNSASAEDLESLPGVGPVTAQKIIAYRKDHGKFSSVDELLAVKGIGPKKLAKIRPFVRL